MPESEQRLRMSELRRTVAAQSLQRWAADFLRDLGDPLRESRIALTAV